MAKKSNAGRPTVMTKEVIGKLEEGFANGATDLQACFYAGISKDALYDYQQKHPEFTERKEGLKNHLALIAKNTLAKSIKSGSEQDSKWLLERLEKKAYSIQRDINNVTEDNALSEAIGDMSVEEIKECLDELRSSRERVRAPVGGENVTNGSGRVH